MKIIASKLEHTTFSSVHDGALFMHLTVIAWVCLPRWEFRQEGERYPGGGGGLSRGTRSPGAHPPGGGSASLPTRRLGVHWDLFPTLRILDGPLAWFPRGLWKLLSLEWCRWTESALGSGPWLSSCWALCLLGAEWRSDADNTGMISASWKAQLMCPSPSPKGLRKNTYIVEGNE